MDSAGTNPITTSIHTFRDIREGGFLYVDKTRYIYELVKHFRGTYFLARPRRFGKSLTLSTLESIFLGDKELFQGLYIYDQPFEWKRHPIIRLDLGDKQASSVEELKQLLIYAIDNNAASYNITLHREGPAARFEELIIALSRQGRVVILIDEYDKPILGNIMNPDVKDVKDLLKAFYSVIKSADSMLRFVLLTGVSKFSRVSIFSDLNNLTDLTMDTRFAEMPGFTGSEIEQYFNPHIESLARKEGLTRQDLLDKIKDWYNGYRFSVEDISLYNPVSIGKLFDNMRFANYWFETGTPTFLVELLKSRDYDITSIDGLQLDEASLSTYEVERLAPEPLLFQTGYITIKDYDKEYALYTLGYPNREVEDSFLRRLMDDFTPARREQTSSYLVKLTKSLKQGDIDEFFNSLKVFFENIPYDLQIKNERYYQTIFYLVLNLIGIHVTTEVRTASGRIDAIIETEDIYYIFEFKLHGTAEDALKQIEEKRYYRKYISEPVSGNEAAVKASLDMAPGTVSSEKPAKILLIGAAFDPKTRNIGSWKVKSLKA